MMSMMFVLMLALYATLADGGKPSEKGRKPSGPNPRAVVNPSQPPVIPSLTMLRAGGGGIHPAVREGGSQP